MANCQHCNQGAIVKDVNGLICPDCIEEGRYDDGQDNYVYPPHLEPELFDQIVAKLAAYNGAFDASKVSRLQINGVWFDRAPF